MEEESNGELESLDTIFKCKVERSLYWPVGNLCILTNT